MSSTENIQKFLMPPDEGGAYTDEKLAALLAHAQDGKLSYDSCCCLIGVPNAIHALQSYRGEGGHINGHTEIRLRENFTKLMQAAESEFAGLAHRNGDPEAERRERLIPLILAEMERREQKRQPADDPEEWWSDHSTDTETAAEMYRDQGIK